MKKKNNTVFFASFFPHHPPVTRLLPSLNLFCLKHTLKTHFDKLVLAWRGVLDFTVKVLFKSNFNPPCAVFTFTHFAKSTVVVICSPVRSPLRWCVDCTTSSLDVPVYVFCLIYNEIRSMEWPSEQGARHFDTNLFGGPLSAAGTEACLCPLTAFYSFLPVLVKTSLFGPNRFALQDPPQPPLTERCGWTRLEQLIPLPPYKVPQLNVPDTTKKEVQISKTFPFFPFRDRQGEHHNRRFVTTIKNTVISKSSSLTTVIL